MSVTAADFEVDVRSTATSPAPVVEKLRAERWAVGTPSRDGRFCEGYVRGWASARGKASAWLVHRGESDIRRGRNKVAAAFLGDERLADVEWLGFIDDDIGWHADQVLRGIGHGVDVWCGLYPKKTADAAQRGIVWRKPREEHPVIKDLVSVEGGGGGFLWIRRRVLETMAQTAPRLKTDRSFYFDFFRQMQDPETEQYLTEDYGFCALARRAGFEVWADRMIRLTHDDGWRVWDVADAVGGAQ
jgi:hypothetical protein